MKLYHAPLSPFVRKVTVLLHEAGATDRVTLVPASGSPLDPGTLPVDRNPLGKIPALERPDGPTLYDSRVITRYLDDLLHAGLYPAAPHLWDTLVIDGGLVGGLLDPARDGRHQTDALIPASGTQHQARRRQNTRPARLCPLDECESLG